MNLKKTLCHTCLFPSILVRWHEGDPAAAAAVFVCTAGIVAPCCCCYWSVASVVLTLCHPMDHSPLGSSVHGIFLARILEWAATPFSKGSSQPRDQTHVSHFSCLASGFFTCWAAGTFFNLEVSDHAEHGKSHSIHSIHLLSGVWKSWWKKNCGLNLEMCPLSLPE